MPPHDELPTLNDLANLSEDDVNLKLLMQGFEAFNQATSKLQKYYRGLEQKVDALNNELAIKNRQLEQNLLEKERMQNYLSNIFESSALGMIVTDLDGQISSINQAGLQLVGKKVEQVQGIALNEVMNATILPYELNETTLAPFAGDNEEEIEFLRDDDSRLTLRLSVSIMYDEIGRLLGTIVNMQNITDLKKLKQESERRNRLVVMGEMAATIAHEIRNPLGSIELFSALLRKELESESRSMPLLAHISAAIESMNTILSNLLEYTRSKPIEIKENFDLHDFFRDMLDFSRHLLEFNNVQLKTELLATNTRIRGDHELLKQVFNNLFMNAIQSMLEPGAITISTRNLLTRNATLISRFNQLGGAQESLHLIEVCFEDTGVGMSPEIKQKIFDPFFTTKERGTGIGLAIVNSILEAHSAVIDVESEVDQGTRFTIYFPVSRDE